MLIDKNNITTNIGNKARNLIWLEKQNIAGATFVVIFPKDLFLNYDSTLKKLNYHFQQGNLSAIRNIFQDVNFDEKKVTRDYVFLKKYVFKKVSFRTSAGLEDLPTNSFAGIYDSFLNINFTKNNFKKYLLLCWQSLYSQRAYAYLKNNNLSPTKQSLSIIIQKMYPAKISGISFTTFPFTKTKLVLQTGLADKLVEGEKASEYIFDKKISPAQYPVKIKELHLEKSFQKLLNYLEAISYLKQSPQDIEWSINKTGVAILQTREITSDVFLSPQQKIIFDSTNISESYPGITSPLTYSFIQYAYSKVYANFMRLVGISEKTIVAQEDILSNLLGYIHGNVYYQINNWYKMIKVFPGYKYNKDFFEAMLVPQKIKKRKKHSTKRTSILQQLLTLPTILKFARKLLFYKKDAATFLDNFNNDFAKHKNLHLSSLTALKLTEHYHSLEKHFLDKWKIPILNDFRLMIFHGLLDKLLKQLSPSKQKHYLNTLISDFKKDDALAVINSLRKLTKQIHQNKILNKLFQQDDFSDIYAQLLIGKTKDLRQFKTSLDNHLYKYGSRRPNELKLESLQLGDQPEFIIKLLKDFQNLPKIKPNKYSENNQVLRNLKNEFLKNKGGLKGRIYFFLTAFIIKRTKAAIRLREVFRLRRGMVYSIARDYFLAFGNIFKNNRVLENNQDIFYLKKSEIFEMATGNALENDYRELVKKRKKILIDCQKNKLPKRLIRYNFGGKENIQNDEASNNIKNRLKGLATSSGIVKGEILILKKFDPKADYKNKILVTYQTDPGWTIVFPLLKGIILEKGNTLSHASILSRELHIPCVVRVNEALELLKNTKTVILNGNNGTIQINEK